MQSSPCRADHALFDNIFGACRAFVTNFDKGEGELTWPKADRIRWAEWRLREWDSLGRFSPDRSEDTLPDRKDLEVWLAKERDGKSWQQIVNKHFPEYRRQNRVKTAGISMARRACLRIERAIAPPRKEFMRQLLDERIENVFGCSPDEFRRYILSRRDNREE
jgi:hypothetical protein